MKLKVIAIVGLGLMGGSLAAACRKKYPGARVIGVTRNRKALRLALKKRWIHEGYRQLSAAVKNADLVVLCTPVDTFPKLLSEIDRFSKPGCMVTDVGSVKANIRRQIQKTSWKRITFVSAHPMMGSHEWGFQAARADLYDRGYTFVIRSHAVSQTKFQGVCNFWKRMTPRILPVSLQEHDRIVGLVSHLPHLLAVCLMLSVPEKYLKFSASGFRDMTRIAASHPSIWLPIFRFNKKELLRAIRVFNGQLGTFLRAEKAKGPKNLKILLTRALKKRAEI